MVEQSLSAVADQMKRVAVDAVDPDAAIERHLRRDGDELTVADRRYDLEAYERVFLVGGGKAAVPMAAAVVEVLGERLSRGVVVTKHGHARGWSRSGIAVIEAGHPVPDENSVRGAQAVADLAEVAGADDLVIALISGGGSALLTRPAPGLTLDDYQGMTDALLRSGATINEINTVRKHCSGIKGGNLARLVAPAQLVTLILSDVIGDPLDVIASGPTVPDSTTVADAREVLERYGIDEGDLLRETPKPGDAVFEGVQNVVVGSNRLAALAAVNEAQSLGFNALLLGTYLEGEAREVGKVAVSLAKGVRADGHPVVPPACLVWGGETTVTVRGEGKGGRNQELALAAALALDGWRGVLIMALATDGTDGPTDAAGATVTGATMERARELGLDARAALEANDSYHFFAGLAGSPAADPGPGEPAVGGLIRTGPTGTNVNDLLFILVA
jgi:hydroxypyruvate reductase